MLLCIKFFVTTVVNEVLGLFIIANSGTRETISLRILQMKCVVSRSCLAERSKFLKLTFGTKFNLLINNTFINSNFDILDTICDVKTSIHST